MLDAAKDEELECGGLYHGLAGLRIYRARVFGDSTAPTPSTKKPESATNSS
jgi:hypothetical protein